MYLLAILMSSFVKRLLGFCPILNLFVFFLLIYVIWIWMLAQFGAFIFILLMVSFVIKNS